MTSTNQSFVKLFQPFAVKVNELTQQFQVEGPKLLDVASRFEQNRKEDKNAKHEYYDKDAARRNGRPEQGKPKAKQTTQLPESKEPTLNVFDGNEVREQKIQKHISDQKSFKRSKDMNDLKKIEQIRELKEQAANGDEQAAEKVKKYNIDTAIKRLHGEKVKDDADKIKKSIQSEKNLKAKKARKRVEEEERKAKDAAKQGEMDQKKLGRRDKK
ncbi:Surfeit_locus protein 6 family protein [Hexamita inflata]|uniref:Surfeit locus protein 6 family protein n=1 Tax=Hexamita inflata TaxID=28002 RepID=A0AA86PES5_9EUKA|nr:Surfeit locus protein 6 family protein [Hexamita inflata]